MSANEASWRANSGSFSLFTGVEAHVLQQQHVAGRERIHGRLDLGADAVTCRRDRSAYQAAEVPGDRRVAQCLDDLPARASAVRADRDPGAGFPQVLDRRQRLAQPQVIEDEAVFVELHVVVDTEEDPAPLKVDVRGPCASSVPGSRPG